MKNLKSFVQSCNKSLINQACSGPYWENIGPRSFLYGPRCARSVLSRPRAEILPVRPSRLVNKIYVLVGYSYVLVCHLCVLVCYSYVLVRYSCVLVGYSYVTRMYSYVTCMLLVCYSYVLVCYSYVLVCTRMLLVCYSCVVLVTIVLMSID